MRIRWSNLVPGVILLLLGLVWVLQGSGVLRGSVMTGQTMWLVIGIVLALVGIGLSYRGLTGRARSG